jgi:hypothetical protein
VLRTPPAPARLPRPPLQAIGGNTRERRTSLRCVCWSDRASAMGAPKISRKAVC